jgi:hypothetical protein
MIERARFERTAAKVIGKSEIIYELSGNRKGVQCGGKEHPGRTYENKKGTSDRAR